MRINCCFKCFYWQKIHVYWKRLQNENKWVNKKKIKIILKERAAINWKSYSGVYLVLSIINPHVTPPHCFPVTLVSPQDMIHIADTKVARRYGDFFIRQIHKFEEVRGLREVCRPGTEVRDCVGSFTFLFCFFVFPHYI